MSTTPAKKTTPSLADALKDKKDDDVKNDEAAIVENNDNDGKNENDKDLDVVYQDDEQKVVKEPNRESLLSPHVVSTVPDKTPAELASETPEETAARYNIQDQATEGDINDPRVQVYADDHLFQVPSSTHLHPDIAKDMRNRGISERTTDSAQVKRTITDTYDFAPDAETNDKM